MTYQLISLASLLTAAGAFVISALTFRRNRRLDNENHIYKLKTEIYHTLTRKAYELVSFYEDAYFELKHAVEHNKVVDFEKYSEDIDVKAYRFEKEVAFHSLVIPQRVLTALEDFTDTVLYGEQEEPTIEYMYQTLVTIYEKVEEVINEFRKDLNVNVLNESLFRRIK